MSDLECAACRRAINPAYVRKNGRSCVYCEGDYNRERTDRMQRLIVELKGQPETDREREVLKEIAILGHPDIEGMVRAIAEKRSTSSKGARR